MDKLGLIAGGGDLPLTLARLCAAAGRPLFVARLRGFADPALEAFEGAEIGLAELGKCIDAFRDAHCEVVCFAGQVNRPDFTALKPDWRGVKALPAILAAAGKGDDALLRALVGEFEREGFRIEGAHQVSSELTLPPGALGRIAPKGEDLADLNRGYAIAGDIGRLDIGQGVVVCRGLVLAVEAQEGTDAMLARCAALPLTLRGDEAGLKGVLVKRPKPNQEQRIDLPTLGVATVHGAARAGLAGIAGQAGRTLVMDKAAVIAAADRLGLFIYGVEEAP